MKESAIAGARIADAKCASRRTIEQLIENKAKINLENL
jgi:hypothetical protein